MNASGTDGDADLPATWSAVAALALRDGAAMPAEERVAEEAAVAIEINGIAHAVMLATPADLHDFALGFLLSEAIIDAPGDLLEVEAVPGPAGVALQAVVLQHCLHRLKERRRSLAGRTGCGLCGTESIGEAIRPIRENAPALQITAEALSAGMRALGERQPLQQATGATHAAGWMSLQGELLLLREDVGRHNALDKLVGAMARARVEPAAGFIAVTSRASYEMVHKSAAAGTGLLAAISAPTGLAIRMAERAGLTLAGFARGGRATLYSHPQRVRLRPPAG